MSPDKTLHNATASSTTRMAMYSHDIYGLGHLRRCLKIGKAMKAAYPELAILLLTASAHAGKYSLPDGMDFVKLPTIVRTDYNTYQPRSLGTSLSDILELRRNLILEAVKTFKPDLMLVDNSPVGILGEVRETLEWLKRESPRCSRVLGMRDLQDESEKVLSEWQVEGVHQVLETIYDHIFIYGTPDVYDPISSYKFGEIARAKTSFTGYIVDTSPGPNGHVKPGKNRDNRNVLLTVGGGEDGAPIVAAYLEMLARHGGKLGAKTTIVAGPNFPRKEMRVYKMAARALQAGFKEFVPDLSPLLKRADLVISMGGYNSVTEILATARRALIIPRTYPRKEQLLRVQRLSEMGLVTFIPPEQLTSDRLFKMTAALLDSEDEPLVTARKNQVLPLDGASQLACLCEPYLRSPTETRHESLKVMPDSLASSALRG